MTKELTLSKVKRFLTLKGIKCWTFYDISRPTEVLRFYGNIYTYEIRKKLSGEFSLIKKTPFQEDKITEDMFLNLEDLEEFFVNCFSLNSISLSSEKIRIISEESD